jgi:hypothetical protein
MTSNRYLLESPSKESVVELFATSDNFLQVHSQGVVGVGLAS